MGKEQITMKHGASMVALFVIGSSLVLGISNNSKQDAWISVLIAFAAMLPIIYIYSRILSRYPGMHVFDICIAVFGKIIGRVVIVLLVWYAVHLGALVMRNFSEFIHITAFNQMPQTVSLLAFAVLLIWATRSGVETLGRYSSVALPVLLVVVGLTVVLLIKDMKLDNLLPIGENLPQVPRDAFNNFSFPFAEVVLFLAVFNTLKTGDKPGKAWLYGLLVGGAALLFGGAFRNVLVLGYPAVTDMTFPSYGATSVIIAGGFLSRIEAVVGANILMAGLVKVSVCLMAASRGVATLIGESDYRPYVAPLGLLMVALASIVYQNTMEMFSFIKVYSFYAFPFQVLIPVVLAIGAEIRFAIGRKGEKKEKPVK